MINAVMLGAIAGAGALPIPADAFEAAIRADGKAVEANLRGFRAGFEQRAPGSRLPTNRPSVNGAVAALADLEAEIARMPEAARADHDRRRAPARRLSGRGLTRGSISIG